MFKELPRFVGFPNQIYVKNQFAFDSFFKTFNGKSPFFVSTYKFKDMRTPIVDSMVFDIDSYFGLRIPYKNVKNLKDFSEEHKIPYVINFSGGKGFHFFMVLKDIIPKNEFEKQELKDKIYSCQEAIVKKCNIEAIDYPTMGRLHFLIRYPTSKYIRFHGGIPKSNGFYCRNITPEDFDKGLKYISKLAKEPGELPKKPKSNKTVDDIIKLLPNYSRRYQTDGIDNLELARSGMITPSLCAVGVPCLQKIAKNEHPNHRERIELVSFLKLMGYTDLAITSFIKKLSWKDYKYAITSYQVSTIKGRFPDCKYLRKGYNKYCTQCSLNRRL